MKTKIDILNRDEFINRVIQLVKLISSNKGNMTFAINGSWGCGKTFVLEEIERRLSEDESKQYLVIHYNCWQYDYYDEPLIALVSALHDYADSTKPIPDDARAEIKEIVTKVGANLFTQVVKNTLKVDLAETITTAKEAFDAASTAIAERHGYDAFFGFKRALTALKVDLEKLSNQYTLIFAVDELDRCLPEYAIKVLERLHHITEELPNIITILSVDEDRLEKTVDSIFKTDSAKEYLKKFIHFEVALDPGRPNGKDFLSKFPKFSDRFDSTLYGQLNGTERFLEELFFGIDAREQEHIVEKTTIFNDLCFGPNKQDHTMMYMELFLATLHYYYGEDSIFSNKKRVMDPLNVFGSCPNMPSVFKSQHSGFCFDKHRVFGSYPGKTILIDTKNIFMVIFHYWYYVPEPSNNLSIYDTEIIPRLEQPNPRLEKNVEVLRRNIKLLEIIK